MVKAAACLLTVVLATGCSLLCNAPHHQGRTVASLTIESDALSSNLVGLDPSRSVTVYLPAGYWETDAPYPTIYCLAYGHYYKNAQSYYVLLDSLYSHDEMSPAILVFIDSQTEHELSYYLNSAVFGNWEDFVADEVVSAIDAADRSMRSSSGGAILGSSVTGRSAFNLVVRRPNVWRTYAANDPAFWLMWSYVDSRNPPAGESLSSIQAAVADLPDSLEGYGSASWTVKDLMQLATPYSPNPNHRRQADFPVDIDGNWIEEVHAKWEAHNPCQLGDTYETCAFSKET